MDEKGEIEKKRRGRNNDRKSKDNECNEQYDGNNEKTDEEWFSQLHSFRLKIKQ